MHYFSLAVNKSRAECFIAQELKKSQEENVRDEIKGVIVTSGMSKTKLQFRVKLFSQNTSFSSSDSNFFLHI